MRLVGDWAEPSGIVRVGSGRPPVAGVAAGSAAASPRPPPAPARPATGGKKSSGIERARRCLTGESVTLVELALTSLIAAVTSDVTQKFTCAHQIASRLGAWLAGSD